MKSLPLLWALILGAVGFACGFFGPIIFSPDVDQGRLLGIFVTGPGGLIAGFVLGLAISFLPLSRPARNSVLVFAGIAIAGVMLYLSMPAPEYRGRLIDAEIGGCAAPAAVLGPAIERWETSIPQAVPRAGWKEAIQQSARTDTGVVLEMHIFRERPIYENRKPWNKGTLEAIPWQAENEMRNYYANDAGAACSDYFKVGRKLYFPTSKNEPAGTWPPKALPNFLDLEVLGPVPAKYQSMTVD